LSAEHVSPTSSSRIPRTQCGVTPACPTHFTTVCFFVLCAYCFGAALAFSFFRSLAHPDHVSFNFFFCCIPPSHLVICVLFPTDCGRAFSFKPDHLLFFFDKCFGSLFSVGNKSDQAFFSLPLCFRGLFHSRLPSSWLCRLFSCLGQGFGPASAAWLSPETFLKGLFFLGAFLSFAGAFVAMEWKLPSLRGLDLRPPPPCFLRVTIFMFVWLFGTDVLRVYLTDFFPFTTHKPQ